MRPLSRRGAAPEHLSSLVAAPKRKRYREGACIPFAGRSFRKTANGWWCSRCQRELPNPQRKRQKVLEGHVNSGKCVDKDRMLRLDAARLKAPTGGCVVVCQSMIDGASLSCAARESAAVSYQRIALGGDQGDNRWQWACQLPKSPPNIKNIACRILGAVHDAHLGWELRSNTVYVLKGGSRPQMLHLDWHKRKLRADIVPQNVQWEWCADSLTFFCPLQTCRPIALAGLRQPLVQHPGDVSIIAANTWHGGLPQVEDSPVLFGYIDRVRGIKLADSLGDVGDALADGADGALPPDYSISVVTVSEASALTSAVRGLWQKINE